MKKLFPGLKRNILLKNHTTFKIGGKAKYFFVAKSKEGLIKAILLAKKNNLPFFILGGGSNILVSDSGYKGLVIKIENKKYKILNTKIYTEAGTGLNQLVNVASKNNLLGLEWAAGIPGAVGGALYGNAGAFRESIKEIVKEVEVFDTTNQKIKILKKRDCKFDYRKSIFKSKKNLIILSAMFQFKKGKRKIIKDKIKKNLEQKKASQPLNFPSTGSIFINPHLPQGLGGQAKDFSAAYLIEKCGLKGKKTGKVKISEKHSNFIVNLGKGKAKDVRKLINLVKRKVKNKFKINLEEEIQFLGF